MALPKLLPAAEQVQVQDTAFTTDALGRFICSTWAEAIGNGGSPFSAVIVGAGAYGAYCAAKLYRQHPNKRVLLLDAGSLLVTEHLQNLGRVGFDVPPPIPPASDPGVARNLVWGMPWRGNVGFPGVAYCAGGKSIYWGGWCPRLTPQDRLQWPSSVATYLNANYSNVESETGVVPATDFIFGELHNALFPRVVAATPTIPNIEMAIGNNGVEIAPLASKAALQRRDFSASTSTAACRCSLILSARTS